MTGDVPPPAEARPPVALPPEAAPPSEDAPRPEAAPSSGNATEGGRPGLIMCVCTGKCPGFEKMDIWDFINRVRIELPVQFAVIHPQLCEEDGDRFLADFLEAQRPLIIAGCAPSMQYKLFRDAFAAKGMDVRKDMVPLDIRGMTTDEAVDRVASVLPEMSSPEMSSPEMSSPEMSGDKGSGIDG